MWRSRSKNDNHKNHHHNNNKDHHTNSPKVRRIPSNPDFNHQSFKDIETLVHHGSIVSDLNRIPEDQPSSSSSSSHNCSSTTTTANNAVKTDVNANVNVKRPSIFHRVNLATKITRAFSARPKPDPEQILSQPNDNNTVAAAAAASASAAAEKSENLEKSKSVEIIPENFTKAEKSEAQSVKVQPDPKITIPDSDQRVVVYMTSLRVIRSTFEACRTVRSILQGFRVRIDERDLSMDSSFFDEIRKIMAQIGQGRSDDKRVELPKVFIGGRYIGGADEVVELHEIGELKKFVKGLPAVTPGVCKFCGGFRFILCLECNGSHKCHTDVGDGGFVTCTVCNENGLIRCPSCLSS